MPNTFEEAYQVALREQGILYRCATREKTRPDRLNRPDIINNNSMGRRTEQPMDVDHARRRNYQGDFRRRDGYRNERRNADRWTDVQKEKN